MTNNNQTNVFIEQMTNMLIRPARDTYPTN